MYYTKHPLLWHILKINPCDFKIFCLVGHYDIITTLAFYKRPMIPTIADCTFTSVSSDESKFLEDFMTFASDFGGSSKERPSLTELTVCDRTGNLSRPAPQPEVQAACTVRFPTK